MIEDLHPYAHYKKSTIDWLGDIPEHWELRPGRACFNFKFESNVGLRETDVLSLSFGRIVVKPPEKLHGLVPKSFETYQIIDPLDIVIRPTDLQNDWHSLRFGLARTRGIITSAYLCFRTRPQLIPAFGHLLLHTYDLKKVFYGLGSGLRQNLRWEDFKHLPCVVPPEEEQAAILRFLEHANQMIDGLIRAKRKLIKLLNEQKQTIIHRAVTRGLNEEVAYKPSNIPWLGNIPLHWEIKRAKYVYREVDERSKTGDEELLSVSHLTGVTPRSEKRITMFKARSYIGHKICRPGDLAINTMWAWMAALGVSKYEGLISPGYAVYRQRPPTHC